MRVVFLEDGKRDQAMMPALVRGILQKSFEVECIPWARLTRHGGYHNKLKYALIDAQLSGAIAVVAIVDQDKEKPRQRLKALAQGRSEHRNKGGHIPVAIGESRPVAEAWLLDDHEAMRGAFGLVKSFVIKTVIEAADPKAEILRVYAASDHHDVQLAYEQIALLVDISRCRHAKTTGFDEFVEEVKRELAAPLCQQCRQADGEPVESF